ncbi:MAG: hypothetical protein WBL95_11615 [Microcoleus sp.]
MVVRFLNTHLSSDRRIYVIDTLGLKTRSSFLMRRSWVEPQLINFLQASLAGKIGSYIVDRCIVR